MSKTIAGIITFCLLCYLIISFMGYFQKFLLSGQDRINRPLVTAVSDLNNDRMAKQ
jgi:hypothetical protein